MKRIIPYLVCMALVLSVSGCGSSNSTSKSDSTRSNTTTAEIKKSTFTKEYEVDGIKFMLPKDVSDYTNSDYVDLAPNQIKFYYGYEAPLTMSIAYYSNIKNIVEDTKKEIKQKNVDIEYVEKNIDGINLLVIYPQENGDWDHGNISFNYSKGAYLISILIKDKSSKDSKEMIDEFVDTLHFN